MACRRGRISGSAMGCTSANQNLQYFLIRLSDTFPVHPIFVVWISSYLQNPGFVGTIWPYSPLFRYFSILIEFIIRVPALLDTITGFALFAAQIGLPIHNQVIFKAACQRWARTIISSIPIGPTSRSMPAGDNAASRHISRVKIGHCHMLRASKISRYLLLDARHRLIATMMSPRQVIATWHTNKYHALCGKSAIYRDCG